MPIVLFVQVLLCTPSQSPAQVTANSNATLLILQLTNDGPARNLEEHLVSELALVLDSFATITLRPELPDFAKLSLSDQTDYVAPLVVQYRAAAAVWAVQRTDGSILLHLVAIESGRTLTKTLQARRLKNAPSTLALAVRELLGTAYLFDSPPKDGGVEVQKIVDELRHHALVDQGTTTQPFFIDWRTAIGASSNVGVMGHHGPAQIYGGQFSVEASITSQVAILGGIAVHIRNASTTTTRYRGQNIAPHVGALALWPLNSFQVGAVSYLSFIREQISISVPATSPQSFVHQRFEVALGPTFRFWFGNTLGIYGNLTANYAPERGLYRRRSDRKLLLSTPSLAWGAQFGLLFGPR